MELSKDAALLAWKQADAAKDAAVANEKQLRAKIIELFSTETNEMHSGTETIDLNFDRYVLKITHKLNYSLADREAVSAALAQIAVSREDGGGNIIAERLVKWKPELSVSEYKKLDGGQRAMIDKVLTIKPASKEVELTQKSA